MKFKIINPKPEEEKKPDIYFRTFISQDGNFCVEASNSPEGRDVDGNLEYDIILSIDTDGFLTLHVEAGNVEGLRIDDEGYLDMTKEM